MHRMIPLIALLLLAGCGGKDKGAEAAAGGDPLAGTAWQLQTIAKADVLADTPVTVEFSEGRIGGSASCNRYFASYEVKGDSLRVGPAGATKMLCPEPVMAQEDLFLAFLADVKTFHLEGGRLWIFRTDGEAMVFAPARAGESEG